MVIAGDDYATSSLDAAAGTLPATTAVAWLAGLTFLPALIAIIIFVPLFFPMATCSLAMAMGRRPGCGLAGRGDPAFGVPAWPPG